MDPENKGSVSCFVDVSEFFDTKKDESDDSGNEEPSVEADFYLNNCLENEAPPASHRSADRLAERLVHLTIPQPHGQAPEGVMDSLPPEVLLVVFRHLDDICVWRAGQVCQRWRQVLEGEMTQSRWMQYVRLRWPLFRPQYTVSCWKAVYTQLLESSPCQQCLERMVLQVLISIQSLLTDPYCHVCMEPKIAKLHQISKTEFERIAQRWTWKYAMHDFLTPCTTSSRHARLPHAMHDFLTPCTTSSRHA